MSRTNSRNLAWRAIAIACGTALVGASAYVVIQAGHQDAAHAALTTFLAIGGLAGSAIVGLAWRWRLHGLAVSIIVALGCAEAYNVIATADRVVMEREAAQAAVRVKEAEHESAVYAMSHAQKAYDSAKRSASAMAAAEVAKAEAAVDDALRVTASQSALRDCRDNCAALLQSTGSATRAALESARRRAANIDHFPSVVAARRELDVARQRAEISPAPEASGSALAERLGWAAGTLDLLVAALLSVATNGLGAALVAFGSHGAERRPSTEVTSEPAENFDTVSATQAEEVAPFDCAVSESAVSRWLQTLPLGVAVDGSQRLFATQAGVSLRSLQVGLDAAVNAGTIIVQRRRRSTSVLRMR
jgi:hypothetical protein